MVEWCFHFFSLLTYVFGTEGNTFILLSFLDQILSADVFSKISKLFWRWKLKSIGYFDTLHSTDAYVVHGQLAQKTLELTLLYVRNLTIDINFPRDIGPNWANVTCCNLAQYVWTVHFSGILAIYPCLVIALGYITKNELSENFLVLKNFLTKSQGHVSMSKLLFSSNNQNLVI